MLIQFQQHATGRDTFLYTKVLQALSNLALFPPFCLKLPMDWILVSDFSSGETEAGTHNTSCQRWHSKATPLLSHNHGEKETLTPPVCPFREGAASEPCDQHLLSVEELGLHPWFWEYRRLSVLCSSLVLLLLAPTIGLEHTMGSPTTHQPQQSQTLKLETVDIQEWTK